MIDDDDDDDDTRDRDRDRIERPYLVGYHYFLAYGEESISENRLAALALLGQTRKA